MNCYTQSGITQIEGKILFLGDSIGDDGRFISFLNTYFRLYNPRADVQLFNLGVCSETISGASEPDHPFPRPCLLNRLDKAISTVKPDWVIMCYGVNDGIYYPQSDERFLAYKDGYKKAIERLKKDNIKIAVMTPPPFDAQSFKKTYGDVLLPKCADKFSYEKPYESYNDVLDDYADWIKSTLVNDVDIVIDVRSWLTRDTAGIRENHPEYLSGDGIHPHEHGHCVMAHCILEDFFGVSLSKFAIQLEQDNFSLFHLVYECDSILHKVLKEEVGHDNPNKENCIASYKLEQSILECEQKIADYISEHPELSDYVEDWEGFETHYIHISGYEVILACPKVAAQGNPWAWRTEFFGAYPSTDIMLLKNGWHIAHIAIPNRFGAPIIM
ncbi:MAG: SGNH/GDSL hydrolase family protein, partial [Oscillospiraceae bacterium]